MKIVIAGGSGLLGSALTSELAEENHELVILTRSLHRSKWLIPGARYAKWSTDSIAEWAHELDDADVVINLAGVSIGGNKLNELRWTAKRKIAIRQSRLRAGDAITAAIEVAKIKPRLLIQASAIGAYGPSEQLNLDEDAQTGTDFLASVVKDWENSTAAVEGMGVRRIVIRTGLVLTRTGGLLPLFMLASNLLAGGPIGSGNQYMSWIHIKDWVGAMRHLISDSSGSGTFNLTAEKPVSNAEFAKVLGQVMGRPAFLKTPGIAIKMLLGESSTLALDGQHVVPQRLKKHGYEFQFRDLSDALSAILLAPRTFRSHFKVDANQVAVSDYHGETPVLRRLTPFPIIVNFKQVEPISEGSKAVFTLWFGPLPVNWTALHYDFNPPSGFSDLLVDGPFELWDHRHTFLPLTEKTTQVQDEIDIKLGTSGLNWLTSRFMWITLQLLFAFRAWKTRKDLTSGNLTKKGSSKGKDSS